MNRSIRSYHVSLSPSQRVIAISDIHANLPVLKKLLKKINYQNHDELFLVGDLLEKGTHNLDTLYYLMELAKNPHVHPMIGNCDIVCRNILYDTRLEFLHQILMSRKNSILHEMANTLSITINEDTDMYALAKILRQNFAKELHFIDDLPHVIETPECIFAHAGIQNEHTYGHDMRDIMVHDYFMMGNKKFHKYIIVGHLPVSEYNSSICNFVPIVDMEKNIISIDGGNCVKHAGQLNALIIQNHQFQFAYSDTLPKVQIQMTFSPINRRPFFITWHESEVILLKQETMKSYCRHLASGKELWIPNSFLYHNEQNIYAADYTTYKLPVKKGDTVKLISSYINASLVKKNGVVGWVPNSSIKFI